jgi:hypothetical protein
MATGTPMAGVFCWTDTTANDVDEAARADARLRVPAPDIPGVGRCCGITSP